jgi:hypothetical protein
VHLKSSAGQVKVLNLAGAKTPHQCDVEMLYFASGRLPGIARFRR